MEQEALVRKTMMILGISAFILIIAGALYYRSFEALPFALGTALGIACNILKVQMLNRAVKKALIMEPKKAGNYIRIQYLIRYLITALALVFAALVPFINLFGTALGILSMQAASFITGIASDKIQAKEIN